jgi:DNA invertase Pin-like site-specific DNA recombinase
MIYGYARVSTKGQDMYGNSLKDQVNKLKEAGAVEIFSDSFTGTKMDRPEFNKLLEVLLPGDVVVVTKLDRFARTASDGAKMIRRLVETGIVVNVLNMGIADNTPMGKLMVQILLAFAEFERDMIVERTTTGKEVKRASDPDWREGRKRIELPDFDLLYDKCKTGEMTVSECCKKLNISRNTWYRREKEIQARA